MRLRLLLYFNRAALFFIPGVFSLSLDSYGITSRPFEISVYLFTNGALDIPYNDCSDVLSSQPFETSDTESVCKESVLIASDSYSWVFSSIASISVFVFLMLSLNEDPRLFNALSWLEYPYDYSSFTVSPHFKFTLFCSMDSNYPPFF